MLSTQSASNKKVGILPIAYDIDDDIGLEFLSPIRGELMNERDCLRIITINMEYGTIISLADIRGVRGRPRKSWIRSKPNLIIHNNMDRATTNRVSTQEN